EEQASVNGQAVLIFGEGLCDGSEEQFSATEVTDVQIGNGKSDFEDEKCRGRGRQPDGIGNPCLGVILLLQPIGSAQRGQGPESNRRRQRGEEVFDSQDAFTVNNEGFCRFGKGKQ